MLSSESPEQNLLKQISNQLVIADDYSVNGDQLQAQKIYQNSLSLLSENKLADSIIAASLNKKMGDSLRDLGKKSEAKIYYEKSISIHSKNPNKDNAESLIIKGTLAHMDSKTSVAESLYIRAIEVLDKLPNSGHPEKARTLRKLGDVYRDAGQIDEAKKCYLKDLKILSENEGERSKESASTLRKLGNLLQVSGNFSEAKNYYEQALAIKRKYCSNNKMMLVNILNNLGSLYCCLNDAMNAKLVLEEAIKIIQAKEHLDISENRYMAFSLKWLARAEYLQGHDSSCLALLMKTEEIENKLDSGKKTLEKAQTMYHFGLYYKAIKNLEQAEEYLRSSLQIFKTIYPSENYLTKEIETHLKATIKSQNILVISAGLTGSGKTTFFRALSKKISNSFHLEKDDICSVLLGEEKYFSSYYNKYVKQQTYETMLTIASKNLQLNKTVFIDGYFGDRLTGPLLKNYLLSDQFTVKIIYFHCSGDEQLKRLQTRNDERDADKIKDFKAHRLEHVKNHLAELAQVDNYLVVDTELDFVKNIDLIIRYMNSSNCITRLTPIDKSSVNMTLDNAMSGADKFSELLSEITPFKKSINKRQNEEEFNSESLSSSSKSNSRAHTFFSHQQNVDSTPKEYRRYNPICIGLK